eukprot:m.100196 g.100196  ORF g.100196 m.100196 type:complete len:485 (-) comp15616_c1_seq1:1301-2755(-)
MHPRPAPRPAGLLLLLLPLLLSITLSAAAANATDRSSSSSDSRSVEREGRALWQWAQQHGITISAAVRLEASNSKGGLALRAAEAVKAGTVLLQIPVVSMVNIEHAVTSKEVGHVWDAVTELSDLDLMGFFLLYEMHKPQRSKWAEYFAVFPKTFDTPLHFSSANVEELRGTTVYDAIKRRAVTTEAVFTTTSKLLLNKFGTLFKPKWLTLENYKWALSALRSRSHLIRIKPSPTDEWQDAMCLVPLADLLNCDTHGTRDNVKCFTEEGSTGLQSVFRCEASKDVAEDAELLVHYIGEAPRRTNANYLTEYGFVPRQNMYNSINVQLPSTKGMPPYVHQLLKSLDLDKRAVAPITDLQWSGNDGPCLALETFCRVVSLGKDDISSPEAMPAAMGPISERRSLSEEHEEHTIECVLKTLRRERHRRPGTVEADREILGELGSKDLSNDPESRHRQLAVRLRLGEKTLLTAAMDYYAEKLPKREEL